MTIKTLSDRACAPIANAIATHVNFLTLKPLGFKLLLEVVRLWDEKEARHKHLTPDQRTERKYLTFRVRWRDLQARLQPDVVGRRHHHIYQSLEDAIKELSCFRVEQTWGKHSFDLIPSLLTRVTSEETSSELVYKLSAEFADALQMMGGPEGFAKVFISDAVRLHDIRHLLMLMIAARVAGLSQAGARCIDVQELRWFFGLRDGAYETWNVAYRKLRAAAKAVNDNTSYRLTLVSIPDKFDARRVGAIRFDSRRVGLLPPPKKPTLSERTVAHMQAIRQRRIGLAYRNAIRARS